MFFIHAMEQIFSFGERGNVPFNSALPHLMKIFLPLHSETFIICTLFLHCSYFDVFASKKINKMKIIQKNDNKFLKIKKK